jgi:hypothetical protein
VSNINFEHVILYIGSVASPRQEVHAVLFKTGFNFSKFEKVLETK